MRRSAAVAAAVALLASGVALAAPAGAAALKPGPVTGIAVTVNKTGGATVTWKAPAVKKGKTVKATSYTVACGSAKKVTVKTTKATVVGIVKSGYKNNLQCSVSAVAGKATGSAAKSSLFTAYVQIGTASFNLTSAALTGLNHALNPVAPATLTANADSTATIAFPVVARNGQTLTLAGGFLVGPKAIAAPVTGITISPDQTNNTLLDCAGYVPAVNGVHTVLVLSNVVAGSTANSATFNVSLTSDTLLVAIFPTFGITLSGGAALGTGTFQ